MKKVKTRTILATVMITVVLAALGLALAGETDNTTASYGYPADTAVGELRKPAETAGDDQTTHTPETPATETTVPETTVPETAAPETTAPTRHLLPLKEEEAERVIFATLSSETVAAAVAGGEEVRVLPLTAIAVSEDGYATFEHGAHAFQVRGTDISLTSPTLVYFILD